MLHRAISQSAPPSNTNPIYIKEFHFDNNSPLTRKDIECPLCTNVLCQPLQMDCGAIVCSGCCHQWVEVASQPSCPCCYSGHPFTPASIRPAPTLIMTVLDSLMITCSKCNNSLQAGQHIRHLESGCKDLLTPSSTLSESRVASDIIRKLLSEGILSHCPHPLLGR